MKLSVIVPVYNERETVLEVIRRVREVDLDKQIIVVDDCSTDGTRELLEGLHQSDADVVLHPRNLGKGRSVRTGIERARGEWTVVQDADLEYDPQDLLKLLAASDREQTDAVFGSRFLTPGGPRGPWLHSFGRNRINDLFRLLYGGGLTDVATCYKMVRTEVLQSLGLRCASFDMDFEIAAKLRKRGHGIIETPIRYFPRTIAQGKKLRWYDGFSVAWCLIKFRFVE
jgi:dolichol-phosphate mannosyltransferase